MKHRYKKRHTEEGREHGTTLPLSPLFEIQAAPCGKKHPPCRKREVKSAPDFTVDPSAGLPHHQDHSWGPLKPARSPRKCQPVREASGHSRPTTSPHEPRLQVGTYKRDSRVCSVPGQFPDQVFLPTRPAPMGPASRPAPRTAGSKTILVPDWPPQTQSPCEPLKPQAPEWLPKPEVWGSSHGRKEEKSSLRNNGCECMCAKLLQFCWLFATLWTIARQAPLSIELSRQEYWLAMPTTKGSSQPRDSPASLKSLALAGRFFTPSTTWEAQ